MHDVYIVFLKCVSSSPIDCTYPHPDEVAERAHKRLYHPAEGLHRDFQKKKKTSKIKYFISAWSK